MKHRLPLGACILAALALVAFGLVYGTLRGYADERREVEALWEEANGLRDVLSYRAADGLNLCVVARRHLAADDGTVLALGEASDALLDASGPAESRAADEALQAAFSALAHKLEAAPGFQDSERDRRYLEMLEADFQSLGSSAAAETYNRAAREFNALLDAPLTGALARLLGVTPCEAYE